MCGITGFIDFSSKSTYEHLTCMTNALTHRGPDDSGVSIVDVDGVQIGLGHRRLSIIDLSINGHQPMHYNDWSIIFNGEIYNYKEIRKELEKEGCNDALASDTSVILRSFDRWGIKAIDKFIGMFAFAIVNKRTKRVYIFRDRAGVKPLYYYWKDDILLFASELKPLHKHPSFKKQINKDALALYFQYGYIPSPYSIFTNTYKVNPGHFLEINISAKHLIENSYWDVNTFYNKPKLKISEEDALQETESLLSSAFEYRMVSDVPVGVFLSGGYDSTVVTTLLQKDRTEKLKTFTIGFEEQAFNEAPYAREVAASLGTEHNEYYCTTKEAKNIIPELCYYYDEPFGDSSAIPTILVSRLARKHVKVALSADAGDETFGGYGKYSSVLTNLHRLNRIPEGVRYPTGFLMDLINPRYIPIINNKFRYQYIYEGIATLLRGKVISAPQIMKLSSQRILRKGISKLCLSAPEELDTLFDHETEINNFNDPLNKILAIDYKTYLTDDILAKVDRATMSVSLEGREPLLDHRIIEFVAMLPSYYKIKGSTRKYLLKKIVHKYIPSSIIDRPKMGFGIPVKDWLRSDMKYLIMEYLDKEKLDLHGFFDTDYVGKMTKNYFEGRDDDFELIWVILQFQMWFCKWCL